MTSILDTYFCPISQPQSCEVAAAAAALDAAEIELATREAMGERHCDYDYIDPYTLRLEHDSFICPWCEVRDRERICRRTVFAPIIQQSRDAKPKLIRSRAERKAHNDAAERAAAIYAGDKPCNRLNLYGDVAPAARTGRQRIEAAAELRRLSIVAEMHNARIVELRPKREAKRAALAEICIPETDTTLRPLFDRSPRP